jgi:hypothetical protein
MTNKNKLRNILAATAFLVFLLTSALPVMADEVVISTVDANNNPVTLAIDADATEDELLAAATLILNGNIKIGTLTTGSGQLSNIIEQLSQAAAEVAGGDAANSAAAVAAIKAAIPDTTGMNVTVAKAATVIVHHPARIPNQQQIAGKRGGKGSPDYLNKKITEPPPGYLPVERPSSPAGLN